MIKKVNKRAAYCWRLVGWTYLNVSNPQKKGNKVAAIFKFSIINLYEMRFFYG